MTSPPPGPADPQGPHQQWQPQYQHPYGAPYPGPQFRPSSRPTVPVKYGKVALILALITIISGATLIVLPFFLQQWGLWGLDGPRAGSWLAFVWWVPWITGFAAIGFAITALIRRERPLHGAILGLIALLIIVAAEYGIRAILVVIGVVLVIGNQVTESMG